MKKEPDGGHYRMLSVGIFQTQQCYLKIIKSETRICCILFILTKEVLI